MNSRRTAAIKVLSVVAALLLLLSVWAFRTGAPVDVEVSQGQTAREIARTLQSQGVIASPRLFKGLSKVTGLDKDIRAGVYRLRRGMSSLEALWRLTHDKTVQIKIVIPEGFSARQIAERLEAAGVAPAADFLEYVRAHNLEGYLFPATYFFYRGMAASEAAHRMHNEFIRQADPLLQEGVPGLRRLGPEQIVTLASIVQREAVLAQERPTIAAVYLNRLAKRIRLEADPTVQYALGYWKRGMTRDDLSVDSPYNTYTHFGLPPGPICSPGLESVKAVLHPAQTDALYFVADNTGGHVFSASFDEHLKAKTKASRERRRSKLLQLRRKNGGGL